MKAPKIIAIVLAVVMIASATAFFVTKPEGESLFAMFATKPNGKPLIPSSAPAVYSYEESAYTKSTALSIKGSNGEIFMPSTLDGIYYTANLKNEIKFYEYANGAFNAYGGEVKTIKTKLTATYEKIPVTISYIVKDGKTYGCGVFTSDMDSSVGVYGFAFVELIDKPAGYGGNKHLLLADFNKNDFYKVNKTYSDFYGFDIAKGTASLYVSNNTRLVDENGTFRQDWSLLTDEFIKGMGDSKFFFSNRNYSDDKRMDVMVVSNSTKPSIAVKGILGSWFFKDEHGMHYLKSSAKGFSNTLLVGDKESKLSEFEGDYFADYMRSGNYIVNKKSLVITDLLVGSTKTLKNIDLSDAIAFSVSPDGNKAVIAFAGKANENGALIQTVIYYNLADSAVEPAIFSEPLLFAESCDFVWLDNSHVMSVRPLDASGARVGSVVYAF